jgi:hypothetical protein
VDATIGLDAASQYSLPAASCCAIDVGASYDESAFEATSTPRIAATDRGSMLSVAPASARTIAAAPLAAATNAAAGQSASINSSQPRLLLATTSSVLDTATSDVGSSSSPGVHSTASPPVQAVCQTSAAGGALELTQQSLPPSFEMVTEYQPPDMSNSSASMAASTLAVTAAGTAASTLAVTAAATAASSAVQSQQPELQDEDGDDNRATPMILGAWDDPMQEQPDLPMSFSDDGSDTDDTDDGKGRSVGGTSKGHNAKHDGAAVGGAGWHSGSSRADKMAAPGSSNGSSSGSSNSVGHLCLPIGAAASGGELGSGQSEPVPTQLVKPFSRLVANNRRGAGAAASGPPVIAPAAHADAVAAALQRAAAAVDMLKKAGLGDPESPRAEPPSALSESSGNNGLQQAERHQLHDDRKLLLEFAIGITRLVAPIECVSARKLLPHLNTILEAISNTTEVAHLLTQAQP